MIMTSFRIIPDFFFASTPEYVPKYRCSGSGSFKSLNSEEKKHKWKTWCAATLSLGSVSTDQNVREFIWKRPALNPKSVMVLKCAIKGTQECAIFCTKQSVPI